MNENSNDPLFETKAPTLPPTGPVEDTRVMSTGEWVVTLLIMMIPCVNIIMLFVWGFGNGNVNRRNYCRAYLIMVAIGIALYLLLILIFGVAMFSMFSALGW